MACCKQLALWLHVVLLLWRWRGISATGVAARWWWREVADDHSLVSCGPWPSQPWPRRCRLLLRHLWFKNSMTLPLICPIYGSYYVLEICHSPSLARTHTLAFLTSTSTDQELLCITVIQIEGSMDKTMNLEFGSWRFYWKGITLLACQPGYPLLKLSKPQIHMNSSNGYSTNLSASHFIDYLFSISRCFRIEISMYSIELVLLLRAQTLKMQKNIWGCAYGK